MSKVVGSKTQKKKMAPFAKNWVLMLKLFVNDDLYRKMSKIRKDFGINNDYFIEGFERIDLYNKNNNVRKKAFSKGKAFWKKLKPNEKENFNIEIQELLKERELGFEWAPYLINIIVSDFWDCPDFNFYINAKKEDETLSLEINSRTTLEDIVTAWPQIKQNQKEIFGHIKKSNMSKKFGQHLHLYMKYKFLKEFTRRNGQYKKVKDLDIIGQLFEDSDDISLNTDKKRVNFIRQIKRRIEE